MSRTTNQRLVECCCMIQHVVLEHAQNSKLYKNSGILTFDENVQKSMKNIPFLIKIYKVDSIEAYA